MCAKRACNPSPASATHEVETGPRSLEASWPGVLQSELQRDHTSNRVEVEDSHLRWSSDHHHTILGRCEQTLATPERARPKKQRTPVQLDEPMSLLGFLTEARVKGYSCINPSPAPV